MSDGCWGIELPDSFGRSAEGEVSGGPDVRAAEGKHEYAVGGEAADALDLGELGSSVVVEGSQPLEIEPAVFEPGGEVVKVDGLRAGEADPAERFGIGTEQLRGCR